MDAAGDGIVPLSIFPGSRKLGDERSTVNREALESEGILMDAYRDRKLLSHYLEPVAIKYDLTLPETCLLLYLSQKPQVKSVKGLSDVIGISRSRVLVALQKLGMREIIKVEEQINVTLLSKAEPILSDLAAAQRDFEKARFSGFEEEELILYASLSNKIKKNIEAVLQATGGK